MSRLDQLLALPKITHNLVQGTDPWHQFRLEHRGASEAAAAIGLSKKMKRTELLHMKHTGLAREFSEWLQRNVLDKGHQVEAKARPLIEQMIGDDLYPVTCSRGPLSASCDGLTMDDRVAMEHKQWAEELSAMVATGLVPDDHMPQCAQVLLVTGAQELYFVVSDGTPERMVWAKVTRADALPWMERVVAGWVQFDADLAAYAPTEVKERPAAEVTLALPALFIHAKGEITTSNMKEYGEALAKRLAEVRAIALVTDQDFSNAKESAKLLRENIQQAKLAKDAMLAQTVTVGEAARMIDTWCEDMRVTALKLEQDVEREDRIKKAAMIAKAKGDYEAHIEALKADTGGPWILLTPPNWPEAIKGKRSYTSMQDALDTMLAIAKIAADESARKIRAALTCMVDEGKGYEFLLSDRLAHIGKPVEDIRTLVRARITEHKAAEERRLEAERERIRAEEQAKAEREARERIAAEQRQREVNEAAARQAREQVEAAERRANQSTLTHPNGAPMFGEHIKPNGDHLMLDAEGKRSVFCDIDEGDEPAPAANVVPMPTKAPAAPSAPTLRLGQINERIAPLSIDAAGLASLGFPHAATDKAAKLFHEADFPRICAALVARIQSAQNQQAAA